MTELIEEFTIKVTINHDDPYVLSSLYGGDDDLVEKVKSMWGSLVERFDIRCQPYTLTAPGVEIEFKHTGIFEVPELSGGDN